MGQDENEFQSSFVKPEISIQECRNILCRNGENYTDEEIKEIRAFMLKMLELDFYHFNTVQSEKVRHDKVIDITPDNENKKPPYKKAG